MIQIFIVECDSCGKEINAKDTTYHRVLDEDICNECYDEGKIWKKIDSVNHAQMVERHVIIWNVNVVVMSKCSNCQGRGWYMGDTLVGDYDEITCEICNGTGKVD